MAERLDEQKLAQLRAWAETLLDDDRDELRAAARGLLLMADEIERLWLASRTAFGEGIGTALAQRLGTDSTIASTAPPPSVEPEHSRRGPAGVA